MLGDGCDACQVPTLAVCGFDAEERVGPVESGFQAAPALAYAPDGTPHVAMVDGGIRDTQLLHFERVGDQWRQRTVDDVDLDYGVRIAVDAAGQPHILYRTTGDMLMLAVRTGNAWNSEVIGPVERTAYTGDLRIDADGSVRVVHASENGRLALSTRGADGWATEIISQLRDVREARWAPETEPPTVIFARDRAPRPIYATTQGDDGWVATLISADCGTSEGSFAVASAEGALVAVAFHTADADQLRLALPGADGWQIEDIDPVTQSISSPSVAIRADGRIEVFHPRIVPRAAGGSDIALLRSTRAIDGTWIHTTVDAGTESGRHPFAGIDGDGALRALWVRNADLILGRIDGDACGVDAQGR